MTKTGFIAGRAKTLKLAAFSLSESIRNGSFKSVFRGSGIEFDEVREYQREDDVRSIDWNITARMGRPYVKRYKEERGLTIFLVLDSSQSMDCGIGAVSRRQQSHLVATLLAFATVYNHDSLGAVFFDGTAESVFTPAAGLKHCMSIINSMEKFIPVTSGSFLSGALNGASCILHKRSLVVIVSDFCVSGYEEALGNLCHRHDVIAIRITDPVDATLPATGYAHFVDAETGVSVKIASSSKTAAEQWGAFHRESLQTWRRVCGRCGAIPLELSTDDDPVKKLLMFFNARGDI